MRRSLVSTLALSLALMSLGASTATVGAQGRLRGLVRIGGEGGGDKVAQFEYEDGSSPDVTAGGGGTLLVGGVYSVRPASAHGLDGQLQAGVKYRTIPPATNQDATWLRYPVEGLLLYRSPMGVRVGGGAVVHLRNVLEASGAVLNGRVEFENTPGAVLQADYVRGGLGFDVRYTKLEYRISRGGSGTVDASSIGAGLTFFFGGPKAAGATP